MSQDNQNSQPPASPEPKGNKSSQKPYQREQPIWKAAIIGILRGTIGVLETAVVKLEAESSETEETSGVWRIWSGLLAKIRSLLPANLSRQLSDTALAGIIAGITVVLVWTTSSIFTSKPTEIATAPPVEEVPVPTPTVTIPPESTAPEPQPPEEMTPTPLPEAQTPSPEAEPEVTPTPTPEPEPEATLPPISEPELEPIPTPTPAVELTPEQILIAAIENQVAEISDRFASGLIHSIQANFRTSNLTVKINDDWYTFKESQQDKLASEILQRSQQLNFSHLEIVDSQDRLIARNPIVGNQIIIFKRRTTNSTISSSG